MPPLSLLKNVAITIFRKRSGSSNRNRWQNPASLDPNWDARTQAIAKMVEPAQTVLEFGAGRMVLKDLLPPGCHYLSSDIVARSPDTIVCDLNRRPFPPFPPSDCVVLCGVLEYVNRPEEFLRHLSQSTGKILCSYVCNPHPKNISETIRRRATQWVNDFTREELIQMFTRAGYKLQNTQLFEGNQFLFEFLNTALHRKRA